MSGMEINTLAEAAIALHELYISLKAAGFTEEQALFMVAQMTRPEPSPPTKPGE